MKTVLDNLKGKLVVSCQALENEPLHSPFIMSRMALAAAQGGAAAIRANSVVDIEAIKQQVSLPVIGIIKRDYPESEVFITATMKEVDELMAVAPEIIALDATARERPGGESLETLVARHAQLDLFSGTVEQYIADAGKKLGGSVKFLTAVRYQTGEGIEKKEENFAAEVAAQMNQGK